MSRPDKQVAIVGGGPAGLITAQRLAESGHAVTVFDRMPSVGRKLLLAGRGGLNLTHSEPYAQFLTRYSTDGHYATNPVEAALRDFDADALRRWADDLGVETFVGTSGRVFPTALRATPLLRAWLARLRELEVAFEPHWEFVGFTNRGVSLRRVGLATHAKGDAPDAGDCLPGDSLSADGGRGSEHREITTPVLLALGGASWPRLGADGSWAQSFRSAGIPVHDLRASNCGFLISWSEHVTRFSGLPLKNVALTIDGVTKRGELLIDPKGLEGSAAYAIGATFIAAVKRGIAPLVSLDLRADVSVEHLTERLSKRSPKMSTATWLAKHSGLSAAGIAVLRDAHPHLPKDPRAMATAIKSVPLPVLGTFPMKRAISSAGGVALDAIDDHFMLRSRPGIFLAGEMLDWDAPTGGYLLQACFATGMAAAQGIEQFLSR